MSKTASSLQVSRLVQSWDVYMGPTQAATQIVHEQNSHTMALFPEVFQGEV